MGTTSSTPDPSGKYAAFFDLDKTLLRINSGKILVREAYRDGSMTLQDVLNGIRVSILYKYNLADTNKIIEKMAYWLKGLEEDAIKSLCERICDEYLIPEISKDMREEVERHRNKGAELVLLSAAVPYICHPIAEHLKIDHIVCTTLEVIDGKFTGHPIGRFVYESEKKVRFEEFCRLHKLDPEQAYCYADSISDLQVLEAAGHPVCVRPDKKLFKEARRRGWELIASPG